MIVKALLGAAIGVFIALAIVMVMNVSVTPYQASADSKEQYLNAKRQIKCLADNVYYEAGNQSIEGKKAVAYVTLNRLYAKQWPTDVCEIVYQKTKNPDTKQTVCQFSWVCEPRRAPNAHVWELSYNIAKHVWYQYHNDIDPTKGSTYFHATYVKPQWKYQKITQIGDHIFYK